MKYFKLCTPIGLLYFLVISCNQDKTDFIKPVPVVWEAKQVGSAGFTASWEPMLGATGYTLEVATGESFEGSMVNNYPKIVNDTTYTVTNLEAGQTYYYRVKAAKNNGYTEYSNITAVKTSELLIPTALDAAEVTPISFIAQWTAISEAEAYLLYIATDVNFSNILDGYNGLEVSDTTYQVKNLGINQQYFYKIKAKRGKATSPFSSIIFAPTSELATPTLLEATEIGLTSFIANWEEVSGATSYLVYVSADPLVSNPLPDYGPKEVTALSLVVVGLNASTPYYYRVQAKNNLNPSGKSEINFAETDALDPPVALISGDTHINSFKANWNMVENASSYLLDVARDAEFSNYLAGYKGKEVVDTLLVVNNLLKSTKYYYRVRAKGFGSISENSNVIEVTTNSFPSPVALNATEVRPTSFNAVWQSVLNADSYVLEVATDANFTSILPGYDNLSLSDTIQAITGLTINNNYFYRVRAINGIVTSGYSNIINQTTTDLSKPEILPASDITLTSFRANWQTVADATSYLVDLATDPLFNEIFADYNPRETDITFVDITGLDANKTYYYRVRARNSLAISENSEVGATKTSSIDAPVAQSASDIQIESFQANWNSVADASSYLLDVAVDAEFKSLLPGFNAREITVTTEVVSGLEPSTTYYYRVRAKGLNSTTSYSTTVIVTTAPLPAPSALSATDRKGFGFTANWTEVTGADSYLLYVATDVSFTQPVTGYNGKEVVGSSWAVTGLDPYKTYYYRLKSKKYSKTSSYSNDTTESACISAGCRILEREFAGQYREGYTYDASNRIILIELFDISGTAALVQDMAITYTGTGSEVATVTIRKDNAGLMELDATWYYNYLSGQIAYIDKHDALGTFTERLRFVYVSGVLSELQTYNDTGETSLIDKEVYIYTNGQITEVQDTVGSPIKKFIYETEFNTESLINPDLSLLLYNPTGSTNHPFISEVTPNYYQYYDTGSSSWKSFSYVYEYNTKGVPVKVLGSGSIPDLNYVFENCSF